MFRYSLWLVEILCITVLKITTDECDRTAGNPLQVFGKYSSLPGDPVEWRRPDSKTLGTCRPNVSCTSTQSGYIMRQNNSGLDYTLLIAETTSPDEGLWILRDGFIQLSTSLTFTGNRFVTSRATIETLYMPNVP